MRISVIISELKSENSNVNSHNSAIFGKRKHFPSISNWASQANHFWSPTAAPKWEQHQSSQKPRYCGLIKFCQSPGLFISSCKIETSISISQVCVENVCPSVIGRRSLCYSGTLSSVWGCDYQQSRTRPWSNIDAAQNPPLHILPGVTLIISYLWLYFMFVVGTQCPQLQTVYF